MERINRQYACVASAEPDFIWVDDDLRLFGHMPVRATCFCARCLEMFADECGTSFDRESLRRTFDEGGMHEKLEVRKAWLEHNRKVIAKVLCAVEASVHTLPRITG